MPGGGSVTPRRRKKRADAEIRGKTRNVEKKYYPSAGAAPSVLTERGKQMLTGDFLKGLIKEKERTFTETDAAKLYAEQLELAFDGVIHKGEDLNQKPEVIRKAVRAVFLCGYRAGLLSYHWNDGGKASGFGGDSDV